MTTTSRPPARAGRGHSRVLEVSTAAGPGTTRVVDEPLAPTDRGTSVLRIHRFAVTSNNVSYFRTRDQLGHGRAFPAASGWMRVPVWGDATVVDGASGGPREGTRVIGYLPMATTVAMSLEPRTDGTLVETSAGRSHLPPIYQQYRVVESPADGLELATLHIEALASALVPDLVGAGVEHVLISSAGSKTGQALAFLLAEAGVACTGLTGDRSAPGGNAAALVGYDDLSSLSVPPGSVFLDIAGDPRLRGRIVAQCGGALARTLGIGGTRLAGPIPAEYAGPASPVVERYGAGPRLAEMEREQGTDAVRLLRERTRLRLLAWARETVTVRRLDGLGAAAAVWPGIVRGGHGATEIHLVAP
ncbi:DUF2855 family protein [Pseudonocardia sp. ICBG1293]|uniref:DUF2855 family protein n=1 Tax=Pseudonocardia sp. ICBG1293 TaxID=2844382 RepID=UPI001CCEE118|nr:DUF2855 family protein [Pseudonocardia sp. ICBG1293]